MLSFARRTGEKKFNLPPDPLQFDSKKGRILPVVAGTQENKSRARFW